MKKVLFIFLIFCFSLNIISCAKKSSNDDTTTTTDTTAPTVSSFYPIDNQTILIDLFWFSY